MSHAFSVSAAGTPDVLQWKEVQVGKPGPGEVRIRQTAVGVNYIDILQRKGLYPISMPSGLGVEGAGVVDSVGEGVTEFKAGQRVAYAGGALGAYAEERNFPAARLVAIPDGVTDEQAAAVLLQGMTAQMLIRRSYRVAAGDIVLVHAAAGGVGSLLCQWAKSLGATVIGTVSSADKAEKAKSFGCDVTINYTTEDFAERVKDATQGKKASVVYDSVGKDTFIKSFDCLRPFGVLSLYGQASGIVAPLETRILTEKGSLYLTRPAVWEHVSTRESLLASVKDLFDTIESGKVKVHVGQVYALKDAAKAHADAEARKTTGATVLTV